MANKDYVQAVNQQIANFNVLYVKLHNYHWYVKGPHFFELHEKFEELYNEVTSDMDALAERLLGLGEKPVATMKEYLELSSVQEASGNETTEEMVAQVAADLKKVSTELQTVAELADKAEDVPTSDMLVGMIESFEKHAWMLRAYLGE